MKLSYTYVDLFDYFVPGNAFAISSDEKIRLEVNESLRKICGKVQSDYAKAKGTRRKEELNSKKMFDFSGMRRRSKVKRSSCCVRDISR